MTVWSTQKTNKQTKTNNYPFFSPHYTLLLLQANAMLMTLSVYWWNKTVMTCNHPDNNRITGYVSDRDWHSVNNFYSATFVNFHVASCGSAACELF